MPSLTVENYLKAILQLELKTGVATISTGHLATSLDVSPGTVTSMLKTLAESGHATYRPYEGVTLSGSGRQVALRIVRRHRLIELFLVETLDLTWDQVHEEAENMEHAVSDFLVDRIDDFLGRPAADPHGDPIPAHDGELRGDNQHATPLVEYSAGSQVRFARVLNQDSEFLRHLSDSGLEVGSVATILEVDSSAGIVTLQLPTRETTLEHAVAEHLLVESMPQSVPVDVSSEENER
jgi:DtxR family transcriptional regulator, Mn-dependent transcriptional regulator